MTATNWSISRVVYGLDYVLDYVWLWTVVWTVCGTALCGRWHTQGIKRRLPLLSSCTTANCGGVSNNPLIVILCYERSRCGQGGDIQDIQDIHRDYTVACRVVPTDNTPLPHLSCNIGYSYWTNQAFSLLITVSHIDSRVPLGSCS